jgi:hypothetical protein
MSLRKANRAGFPFKAVTKATTMSVSKVRSADISAPRTEGPHWGSKNGDFWQDAHGPKEYQNP